MTKQKNIYIFLQNYNSLTKNDNMKKHLFIYDLETTGYITKKEFPQIVELAIYHVNTGKCFQSLCKPTIPNNYWSVRTHHITKNDTRNEPTFDIVVELFMDWIQEVVEITTDETKKKEKRIYNVHMLAHNNDRFDEKVLRHEFERIGKKIPDNWIFYDSLKIIKNGWFPKEEKYNITFLFSKYCGKQLEEYHRAMNDVLALYEVIKHMFQIKIEEKNIKNDKNFNYDYHMILFITKKKPHQYDIKQIKLLKRVQKILKFLCEKTNLSCHFFLNKWKKKEKEIFQIKKANIVELNDFMKWLSKIKIKLRKK